MNKIVKMSEDILKEIPDDKLPALRDLFKANWPFAMHAYYFVDNYIDWKQRGITNIKFLCPDGQWDDGTFITIEDNGLFVFSLEKSCKRLINGLFNTSKIKWNEKQVSYCFLAVHEAQQQHIMKELLERGVEIKGQDISNMWWIPKEEAINYQYEIPSDVYVAPLKEKDVDLIDSVWPHKYKGSNLYLLKLITANGGFGLYLKADDSLAAWIMRNNYGGMAILQTLDAHKRKGYGRILSMHFSKLWAEKGLDIFCFIMTHNKPSLALFEKLGWRKEHGITWTICKTK